MIDVLLAAHPQPTPPSPGSTRGRQARRTTEPLVQEGRLLKGAVDDRGRVQFEPLVQDRRVDATEVHVRVHITLNEMFRFEGRHLAVVPTLNLFAEHEGDAAGA